MSKFLELVKNMAQTNYVVCSVNLWMVSVRFCWQIHSGVVPFWRTVFSWDRENLDLWKRIAIYGDLIFFIQFCFSRSAYRSIHIQGKQKSSQPLRYHRHHPHCPSKDVHPFPCIACRTQFWCIDCPDRYGELLYPVCGWLMPCSGHWSPGWPSCSLRKTNPPSLRLNTSMTTAKYRNPDQVEM